MREVEYVKKSLQPLSQSRHGDMACETLYVRKHVRGTRIGESDPAARGIEIHQVLASYINHLVRTRRATDLDRFDALIKGAGDEAREVLEKFRGSSMDLAPSAGKDEAGRLEAFRKHAQVVRTCEHCGRSIRGNVFFRHHERCPQQNVQSESKVL